MKKIIILLALLPLNAYAQKWEIRIGGGATFITSPKAAVEPWFPKYNDTETSGSLLGFLSVSKRLNTRNLSIGLRVGVGTLKRTTDQAHKGYPPKPVALCMGLPTFIIQPFASYTYKGFFGGTQIGIITWQGAGSHQAGASRNSGDYYKITTRPYVGLAAGVHAGYQIMMSKHLGAFADMSCNFIRANATFFWEESTLSFFQPQGVIGLSYLIHK